MSLLALPGHDRPYVAAPFLGILVTVPVQILSGSLGLVPAQTVVVSLIAAGLAGGVFGTQHADNTPTAASLTASLAAGGAVIVLIVAGSL